VVAISQLPAYAVCFNLLPASSSAMLGSVGGFGSGMQSSVLGVPSGSVCVCGGGGGGQVLSKCVVMLKHVTVCTETTLHL
jgi:hypothetical protein